MILISNQYQYTQPATSSVVKRTSREARRTSALFRIQVSSELVLTTCFKTPAVCQKSYLPLFPLEIVVLKVAPSVAPLAEPPVHLTPAWARLASSGVSRRGTRERPNGGGQCGRNRRRGVSRAIRRTAGRRRDRRYGRDGRDRRHRGPGASRATDRASDRPVGRSAGLPGAARMGPGRADRPP